jgi:hypothetical protein
MRKVTRIVAATMTAAALSLDGDASRHHLADAGRAVHSPGVDQSAQSGGPSGGYAARRGTMHNRSVVAQVVRLD